MLLSCVILALYAWSFFGGGSTVISVIIDDYAAIAAGITFAFAATVYIFGPKKHQRPYAFVAYFLLCVTAAVLVAQSGWLASPFIVLWILMAVFAPLFGLPGVGIVLLFAALYIFKLHNLGETISSKIIPLSAITILPIATGYLIRPYGQNSVSTQPNKPERSVLTDELVTVSGQSEVVIAAISDGVIAINGSGNIQLINPAAQHLIGWGKEDALKLSYKSVLKLVDSRDKPVSDANDPVQKSLATNQEVRADVFNIVANDTGKKFLAHISVSPLGKPGEGVIIVFRDITHEKAEEREQAEFISTASHEMRTPVASIEGYLGLALNPATATIDAKARDYIQKAQESVTHLGHLFQDLLDTTKADDGRLSNNPKVTDLVQFTHDITEGLLPAAHAKNLTLTYKPEPDLGEDDDGKNDRKLNPIFYVDVDNDHLREVLNNLIENAIKYTPQGSVVVDVTGDSQFAIISVKDSGIGIPVEDIPHLFQKFYRVDNSETREIGGTGLGLYLSRKITELMGGKMWVESVYKQGSTFFVKLPRLDPEAARQELAKEDANSFANKTLPSASTAKPEDAAPQPPKAPIVITDAPVVPATPQPAPTIAPSTPAATPVVNPTLAAPQPVVTPAPTSAAPQPQAIPQATATTQPAQAQRLAPTIAELQAMYKARQNTPQQPQSTTAAPVRIQVQAAPARQPQNPAAARTILAVTEQQRNQQGGTPAN